MYILCDELRSHYKSVYDDGKRDEMLELGYIDVTGEDKPKQKAAATSAPKAQKDAEKKPAAKATAGKAAAKNAKR